ncbi:hypothetical protein Tco_1087641 [Tanacetum coccineum]
MADDSDRHARIDRPCALFSNSRLPKILDFCLNNRANVMFKGGSGGGRQLENHVGEEGNLMVTWVLGKEVSALARKLVCEPSSFPFTYLGLPIGASMSRSVHWQPIIDRFSEKLSSWKGKNVSYGGRLTLVKSMLGSLHLYYFSLFRAPLKVINVLEGIRRQFFWVRAHGDSRKISRIAWDKVLSSSEFGGLNIGSLKAPNWSLLAKWRWCFKTEKNSLWKKVVCSFHGSDGNLGVASDVGSPGTWGKIVSIRNELEKIDISFSSSFHKKIGSGHDTRFWTEIWSGNTSFSEKYPRLFALETNKLSSESKACRF